jgi:hypothetical protein
MTAQSGHPRARKGYVAEHILVVERALGHYLGEKHPVHHVDENKQNNANTNLVACEDHAYHMLLHRRLRALLACGDANAHRCTYCHRYDNQDDITLLRGVGQRSERSYHRRCAAEYMRRSAPIQTVRDL